MYTYMYVCTYIYIHTENESEREIMIYMLQVKSAGFFGLLGTLSSDNSSSTSPHKPKFVDFKRQSPYDFLCRVTIQ